MQIFDIVPRGGFELCHPKDDEAFARFSSSSSWESEKSPEVEIVRREYDGSLLKRSDAPFWLSDVLILREQTYLELQSVLMDEAEATRLDCREDRLVALTPTTRLHPLMATA